MLLKSEDLRDTLDTCFTVSAVFVNGHCYGYSRDSSNYYEGHNRTKNKTDCAGNERMKIHQVLFCSVVSFMIVAVVSAVAISLSIDKNRNHSQTNTMKMNKQAYRAYAKNFDSHLENMMRSDGHTNTWGTEAEILATNEAYKCDVFVPREQYRNIGWQKFSFDKECNHNKKSIKILNTANHFKLVTDEKRVCICVEWSKGGKSVILNDRKTTKKFKQ